MIHQDRWAGGKFTVRMHLLTLAISIRTNILEESLNSHQIWYLLTSVFPKLSGKASDGVETRKPNAT